MNADKVIRIPTKLGLDFFVCWFTFLKPFHNLTEKETKVAAALAHQRYELSKVIKDENIIDTFLMNTETKAKVMEESSINSQYFQVILGKLRKAKILVDNKLNPRYIPNINDDKKFVMALYFDFT